MKVKEARREIGKMMKIVSDLSNKIVVVTSIQEGKYSEWVLPEFKKRINLGNYRHGRLTADLYNQGNRKSISLTDRELKTVVR
jgi:hypothetical protein